MSSFVLQAVTDIERRGELPVTRRRCWQGRIVESGLGCGVLITLATTIVTAIFAYLSTVPRGVGSYFSADIGTQILLITLAVVSCLICACLCFGAVKIECDRPYVGTGKDVKKMKETVREIGGQIEELKDITDRTEASRGVFAKLYHKAVGQHRQDRHEAKALLSNLRGIATDFVGVSKVIEEGQDLTRYYLQQVKSEVGALSSGEKLSEEQHKRMMLKVEALKGLLQHEQTTLKQLAKGSEEEKAALEANRRLLEEFASLKSGDDLGALTAALGDYESISQKREEIVARFEKLTVEYGENLVKEEESTSKLDRLLSLAGDKLALQEKARTLETLLAEKASPKELQRAIEETVALLDRVATPNRTSKVEPEEEKAMTKKSGGKKKRSTKT